MARDKNFEIRMRWTEKGAGEIDDAVNRRSAAISLMKTYTRPSVAPEPVGPFRLIQFTHSAPGSLGDDTGDGDITYLHKDKRSHVLWAVTAEAASDVKDFAEEMSLHGYVKCHVKRVP